MEFGMLDLLFKYGREFGHRRIRSSGLSDTECLLCSFVSAHPGCSQDDAVQGLHMDKTTAAKALHTLEEKGCVIREQSPDDRRKKMLTVTEAGTEKLSTILHLHDQWMSRVLSILSPEEQAQFEDYCVRLLRAAETMQAESESDEPGGKSHGT